jgi:hypothetical protein
LVAADVHAVQAVTPRDTVRTRSPTRSLMALPHARPHLFGALFGVAALAACGSEEPLGPAGGTFSIGQAISVESGRDMRVLPGATDGEFIAVVANVALDSNSRSSFRLSGTGIVPVETGPFTSLSPDPDAASDEPTAAAPRRDAAFEERLRDRERAELTPRFAAARSWNASRVPSLPTTLNVGDLVTVNVNPVDPCTNATPHAVRVVAVGTKALILADTLNPRNGFTTADYQRYAARFDTLVYPMDVAAFGEPTDIDKNGRIAIVFTRAVNELTPRNAFTYVGGLTFSRDLFPQVATTRASACLTSNEGEFFYLMAPDPTGLINGNRRSNGFVDTNTTAVIAHELVHLINASRKLYVHTTAPKFEEKWLDEGLAHAAEELLFYRESGVAPRSNLSYQALLSTARIRNAYLTEMGGNTSRYRDFLSTTVSSSPYAVGDSVATRGAAWSFLRYLVDRASSTDGDKWSRLVNNTAVGMANLKSVFGNDIAAMVRDWSVSLAVDDIANTQAELRQQSWNYHSIYGGVDASPFLYPLRVTPMTPATSYNGTVVAGGSTHYKLAVPANGTAIISLSGPSGAASSNLQLVIVRTK